MSARRRASDWDRTAPTTQSYAGFRVGQEVVVTRNTKTVHCSFAGTIIRICVPLMGWKFVVVQDGTGGTHACDFGELN